MIWKSSIISAITGSTKFQDKSMDCPFCLADGGTLLWKDAHCRIVLADEPGYPGFCRLIWNSHVREMSDLIAQDQAHCLRVVLAVERAQRAVMSPLKINLASFGNLVPHLHWHIIPRFADDPHFPQPVWGERQRSGTIERAGSDAASLGAAIAAELQS